MSGTVFAWERSGLFDMDRASVLLGLRALLPCTDSLIGKAMQILKGRYS